jgi:hypothetical protein
MSYRRLAAVVASSCGLLVSCAVASLAQTIDDGVLMSKKSLCTGFLYTHDSWDHYWEGTRKRTNGNIGTITTQSIAWMGTYGVTDRLNVVAMVPYVWTNASQGVLQGQSGIQDLTVAAKYNVLQKPMGGKLRLRTFAVASAETPLSSYTPDFLPLSIGLHDPRVSLRGTANLRHEKGWFVNASGAYTWCDNVTLDRTSYFTNGEYFMTDEVEIPNVFSYVLSAGYMRSGLQIPISFSKQVTQGGGDIRRQDMPFVSNKMNFTKIQAMALYTLPRTNLALRAAGTKTVDGRNVGQSVTLSGGLLYTFKF